MDTSCHRIPILDGIDVSNAPTIMSQKIRNGKGELA